MTLAALCAHPAYVARPQRGGRPRHDLVEARTPVLLREAGPGEFRPLGRVDGATSIGLPFEPWLREGALWMPVRRLRGEDGRPSDAPVRAGEFAAFLENRLPRGSGLAATLSDLFNASPLSRRRPVRPWETIPMEALRGRPVPEGEAGRIDGDERPACAAAVAEFLDREVRIVEGALVARIRPLIRRVREFGGDRDLLLVSRGGTPEHPCHRPGTLPPLPVRRPPEALADRVAQALALVEGLDAGDDDLVAMANVLPAALLAPLAPAADGRGRGLPGPLRQACAEARDRIAALDRLGSRGLVLPAAMPDAYEAMAAAGRLLAEAGELGFRPALRPAVDQVRAYLLGVALPRLAAARSAEDDTALAALTP